MEKVDFVIDDEETLEIPFPEQVTGWESVVFTVEDAEGE